MTAIRSYEQLLSLETLRVLGECGATVYGVQEQTRVGESCAIPDARKDVPYSMPSEARWRSAAEVDRVESGGFKVRTQAVQLGSQAR